MRHANAVSQTVTDFGVDPNNPSAGLLRDTFRRLSGTLVQPYVGGDVDPGLQWSGDTNSPQDFDDFAAPVAATVFRNGDVPELSSVRDPSYATGPARIFEDRLRRRR